MKSSVKKSVERADVNPFDDEEPIGEAEIEGNVSAVSALFGMMRAAGVDEKIIEKAFLQVSDTLGTDAFKMQTFKTMAKMASGVQTSGGSLVCADADMHRVLQHSIRRKPDLLYSKVSLDQLVAGSSETLIYDPTTRRLSIKGKPQSFLEYTYGGFICKADASLLFHLGYEASELPIMKGVSFPNAYCNYQTSVASESQQNILNKNDHNLAYLVSYGEKLRHKYKNVLQPLVSSVTARAPTDPPMKLFNLGVSNEKGVALLGNYKDRVLKPFAFNDQNLPLGKHLDALANDYLRGTKSSVGHVGLTSMFDALHAMRNACPNVTKCSAVIDGPEFASVLSKLHRMLYTMGMLKGQHDPVPELIVEEGMERPAASFFLGAGRHNITCAKANFNAYTLDIDTKSNPDIPADAMKYTFLPDDVILSDVLLSEAAVREYMGIDSNIGINAKVSSVRINKFDRTICMLGHLVDCGVKKFCVKLILAGYDPSKHYELLKKLMANYRIRWTPGGKHHNSEVFLICERLESPSEQFTFAMFNRIVGIYMSFAVGHAILRYRNMVTIGAYKSDVYKLSGILEVVEGKIVFEGLDVRAWYFAPMELSGRTAEVPFNSGVIEGANFEEVLNDALPSGDQAVEDGVPLERKQRKVPSQGIKLKASKPVASTSTAPHSSEVEDGPDDAARPGVENNGANPFGDDGLGMNEL